MHTQRYIEILQIRYRDKFKVVLDIDDADHEQQVMKLLFQPLIENAVYHGVMESGRLGYIRIRVHRSGSEMHVRVTDTGIGMSRERLAEVKRILTSEEYQDRHIGLYNIYKRLQLMYDGRASFKIRSRYGWGTMIDIRFPLGLSDEES